MKPTVVAYFAFLIFNITVATLEIDSLRIITKPLLMPLLALYYWKSASEKSNLLFIALLFSWLGDIFLMFEGQQFFLMGLGSFLIAHLTYSLKFYKKFSGRWLPLLPLVSFGLIFTVLILGDSLPEVMQLPVYVYISAIIIMVFLASARNINQQSFVFVLTGALLFMLSDACIALNTFNKDIPYPPLWIMTTYGLGQYLIVKGILEE
ncbi:lysoplasmalogenase [Jiulongibacter sp. NS-SX5]|uniref:lysoplasmalogenase n=1 Tax=Jiulongibacter sp. NS-SX5 TaxID=3463854 RepID=UPI004059D824